MISFLLYLLLVFVARISVDGCGITTHIENGERAASYLNTLSEGVDYKQLLTRHPDAMQAGSPYPDAFYPGLCFDGIYHQESEDTHWTPFLTTAINYIRNNYTRPWDVNAQKLVVFLFGIVQHQVSDATWHSLGIDQGFLDTMGKVNFWGSFGKAHDVGDTGGDVLNVFELDMGYVGTVSKWYVPTEDLVEIYKQHYGDLRMTADVIENCTLWLFLGRLGESLGVIDLLYPRYVRQSPFLLDALNDYYLGGIDDMATWTGNVFRRTVKMLDRGTQECDLPENPIWIRCRDESGRGLSAAVNSSARARVPFNDVRFTRSVKLVQPGDVNVRHTDRGVVFSATHQLKRRLKARLRTASSNEFASEPANPVTPESFYTTQRDYSRAGQTLLSGDVNGDGHDDLIISAPLHSTADNYQRGRVYVIYGSESGIPSRNLTLETSANVVRDGPHLNGRFGQSTALVDLNADGFIDLAISAPSVGSETLDYFGYIYVYFGSASGLAEQPSVNITCTERYCNLGWRLLAGDINNDGRNDLIIGSPFSPGGGRQRGTVGVIYASSQIQVGDHLTEANFNWKWTGIRDYEWFGYSISISKISTEQTWLAVGSPTYRLCYNSDCRYDERDVQSAGKVEVFRTSSMSSPAASLLGTDEFEQFGFHVNVVSGLRGQDFLIVSAVSADSVDSGLRVNLTQSGYVRLYRILQSTVDTTPWATLSGDTQFDRFGSTTLVYESVNDKKSHILVSAPKRSENLVTDREGGRVYDFLNFDVTAAEATTTILDDTSKSRLGSSMALIRNQNKVQLAIGAPHFNLYRKVGQITETHRLAGHVAVVDL